MMTPREKLQALLFELFQFDSADLNFGIYAVMNRKRTEIQHFIQRQLLDEVQRGLQQVANQSVGEAKTNFEAAKQALIGAFGPDALKNDALTPAFENTRATPIVQTYLKAKAEQESSVVSLELEMDIYNALYEFFSRYYKDGDFMPERRYGSRDSYAIPYNGDEVYLHWANRDQYYVKTSEYFTNYRFTVKAGLGMTQDATIAFELTQADTARDNNKAPNRYFIQPKDHPPTWDADQSTLRIPFQYRSLTDDEKKALGTRGNHIQPRLNDQSHDQILAALVDGLAGAKMDATTSAALSASLQKPHAAANGQEGEQDELAYQLKRYTAANSRDFFVHKDLTGFLTREFEYYLKAEVADLDNLQSLDPVRLQREGAKVATTRTIGSRIIAFLDQIESFQKMLFLKPKFVLQSDYCLTLDKIPEADRASLYPQIAANPRQRAEWATLYGVRLEADADLSQHPHLMVDTAFFDGDFKLALLGCLDDIDEACDGLLIHGENFQALGLMSDYYRQQVKCIYIDPPYNTDRKDFYYKDSYIHSSWITFMENRLGIGNSFQTEDGIIIVSIDDSELANLRWVLDKTYGSENHLAVLTWDKNRKNDATFFSVGHEYMVAYAIDQDYLRKSGIRLREPKEGIDAARNLFQKLRQKYGDDWSTIQHEWRKYFNSLQRTDPAKKLGRFSKVVDKKGPFRDDGNLNWPGGGGPRYQVIHPVTKKPVRIPKSGWRYASPDTFWQEYDSGRIAFGRDETTVPGYINYLFESDEQVMETVHYSYAQTATNEFNELFVQNNIFDNPKNWRDLYRTIRYVTTSDSFILDYFAGSGTTAHAVMNLNREDGGNRKYILVEMGDHFNTVLKPRIQKVAYASDWKDGQPINDGLFSTGMSHMFQYLRLESYDDTFHNIAIPDDGPQKQLFGLDDYLLTYMLPHETQESPTLLNVAQLRTPFDYKLNVAEAGGALTETAVDLITTFNFLIGLRVRTIQQFVHGTEKSASDGATIVRVLGTNRQGQRICILWRNVPDGPQALDAERDWLQQNALHDVAYDILYVNGDSTLPEATILDAEFKRLMMPQAGVS